MIGDGAGFGDYNPAAEIRKPKGTPMPNIRWLISFITRSHRFMFLATGGRIGSWMFWMRFLLLSHTGRRSGVLRHTPLLCIEDEGRWIVVGSNGGDDRPPAWWLNLQNHPEVEILYFRDRIAVKARAASESEYEVLWAKLLKAYSFYDAYRTRTDRKIPVVVLERCE
jgi:deazaflavin-dependent oxidoreductase (nitroreductase family)